MRTKENWLQRAVPVLAIAALLAGGLQAAEPLEISMTSDERPAVAQRTIKDRISVDKNFLETGHTIMRRLDGGLNSVLVEGADGSERLRYLQSSDEGKSWKSMPVGAGSANVYPALDSNEHAVYIAYVAKDGKGQTGRVARIDDPLGSARVSDSGALTSASSRSQYSSVAASRLGVKSVAYAWYDAKTGAVTVGVSPDGVNFPKAKTVATDKNVRYGPSVGIFGKYVFLTYQTTNPAIAPSGAKGAFGAYLESDDGGATWSQPRALFGRDAKALPAFNTVSANQTARNVRLAGAPATSASRTQALAWMAATVSDSRVFVTSVMSYAAGGGTPRTVAVVSSKLPQKGGTWTHVVADTPPNAQTASRGSAPNGSFHQYSALPGTPLRVVSYVDEGSGGNDDALVAQISTDNAQHFTKAVRFTPEQLGLPRGTQLALRASLCLWRDKEGNVSLDTFLTQDARTSDGLFHSRVPLGIRLSGGEVVTVSNW